MAKYCLVYVFRTCLMSQVFWMRDAAVFFKKYKESDVLIIDKLTLTLHAGRDGSCVDFQQDSCHNVLTKPVNHVPVVTVTILFPVRMHQM